MQIYIILFSSTFTFGSKNATTFSTKICREWRVKVRWFECLYYSQNPRTKTRALFDAASWRRVVTYPSVVTCAYIVLYIQNRLYGVNKLSNIMQSMGGHTSTAMVELNPSVKRLRKGTRFSIHFSRYRFINTDILYVSADFGWTRLSVRRSGNAVLYVNADRSHSSDSVDHGEQRERTMAGR